MISWVVWALALLLLAKLSSCFTHFSSDVVKIMRCTPWSRSALCSDRNSEDDTVYPATQGPTTQLNRNSTLFNPTFSSRDAMFNRRSFKARAKLEYDRTAAGINLPAGVQRLNPAELKLTTTSDGKRVVEQVESFRFVIKRSDLERVLNSTAVCRGDASSKLLPARQIDQRGNQIHHPSGIMNSVDDADTRAIDSPITDTPRLFLHESIVEGLRLADMERDGITGSVSLKMDYDRFQRGITSDYGGYAGDDVDVDVNVDGNVNVDVDADADADGDSDDNMWEGPHKKLNRGPRFESAAGRTGVGSAQIRTGRHSKGAIAASATAPASRLLQYSKEKMEEAEQRMSMVPPRRPHTEPQHNRRGAAGGDNGDDSRAGGRAGARDGDSGAICKHVDSVPANIGGLRSDSRRLNAMVKKEITTCLALTKRGELADDLVGTAFMLSASVLVLHIYEVFAAVVWRIFKAIQSTSGFALHRLKRKVSLASGMSLPFISAIIRWVQTSFRRRMLRPVPVPIVFLLACTVLFVQHVVLPWREQRRYSWIGYTYN